jgi:predicted cobalt transporter CbtA
MVVTFILEFWSGKVIFTAQVYEKSEIAQSRDYLVSMNV